MRVVDLFSGCGGLSHGARLAGLTVSAAVEADVAAAASYRENYPDALLIERRIETVDPDEIGAGGGDLVICGGPPCQGFSSSNQRNRSLTDRRNHMYAEMIRFSDALDPSVLIFENVYGITEGEKKKLLDELLDQLKRRFKTVEWCVLNAAQYGVPQSRRRVFVVARRSAKRFSWPTPNGSSITVSQALGDLPFLRNGWSDDVLPYRSSPQSHYAEMLRGCLLECSGHTVSRNADYVIERYRLVPQGGNWRDIPSAEMANYRDRARCHTGIYHRLSEDAPSIVIGNYRKNMLIHHSEDRGLSIREAARLQSFPDSFVFKGSIGKRQQQVGNAVPPLLASAVMRHATDI